MRYLYLSLLALCFWQCTQRVTDELTPEPGNDDNAKTNALVSAPFILSASNTISWDVALDTANNIYITGNFWATATFGNITKTAVGGRDMFVAKYNQAGVVQWVNTLGSAGADDGRSIVVDSLGNVYVTGDFQQTVSAGSMSVTSRGSEDVFLIKYNTQGIPQWIRSGGSDGGERGWDLTIDHDGNLYATGEFQGTAHFGTVAKQSQGEFDVFVVKYDKNGAFKWFQTAGGKKRERALGIAADRQTGDVYVTGSFADTTTLGTKKYTSAGDTDVFLIKLKTDGVLQWAQTFGSKGADSGQDLAVDGEGNVFVTGQSAYPITFRNVTGTVGLGFIAKYTSTGILRWGRSFDFPSEGMGVATDSQGNAYVATANSAILKYRYDGIYQRPQFAQFTDSAISNGIAVNRNNKMYITGYYRGALSFAQVTTQSKGGLDLFVIGGSM